MILKKTCLTVKRILLPLPHQIKTALLVLLFPMLVLGQELTSEQVWEDYTILKSVLVKGHPSLYDYTTKAVWDQLFTEFETTTVKALQNKHDLYKSLTALTDHVRDGHLIVMRPLLDSIPNLFPLLLKIIDGQLYTATDDFEIPIGAELLAIDGTASAVLLKQFMKYAPADGYNTTKKDRQVEREFGILHFYEFGSRPTYQITYKTPTGVVLQKTIYSQPFESIGARFVTLNSNRKNNNRNQKMPFLYVIDSLQTAVLTLPTFHLAADRFQSELATIFKEIKRKKSQHLIVDIRQNDGGYPQNAISAFSYLTK